MSETGPLFVSSGDLLADRRYAWALDHAARGDLTGAADILEQTVERAPAFAAAWFTLGTIRDQLGDRVGAINAFKRAHDADPQDHHGAGLQLARLGASEANPAMSESYVRQLFDQYAVRYDAALTERLAYRGPSLLRTAIETAGRATARPLRFAAMLDLGCGTGLAGAAFRDIAELLVGVDLSAAMIAQAAAKHIYDRLIVANLTEFLDAEAQSGARYDLVTAADVFVYINDPAPVIAAITRLLAPGALFAFTAETHSGDGSKLLPTLRYAHAEPCLRGTLKDAGLAVHSISPAAVRSEKGAPVDGLVVVAGLDPAA